MLPTEAIQIITDEQLYIAPYNWFETRRATEDEVGLIKKDHQWQVYTASERANPSDIKEYDAIEVALDDFIQRLRDSKEIILERVTNIDKMNKADGEQYYLIATEKRKIRYLHLNEEWLSKKDCIYQTMK